MNKITLYISACLILLAACKKDDNTNNAIVQSDEIAFLSCPVYEHNIHYKNLSFAYSANLKAVKTATGKIVLTISDSTGGTSEVLKEVSVNLVQNENYEFSFSGAIPAQYESTVPRSLKLLLQFTADGTTISENIGGQGCGNPVYATVKDTLYGRAQAIVVNARYDLATKSYTINEETIVNNLAGNTNSVYTDAPSGTVITVNGQMPKTPDYLPYDAEIHPNTKYTCLAFLYYAGGSGSSNEQYVVVADNLNQADQSKAYVRFVNVYSDYDISVKLNGGTVAQFESVPFRGYTPFVPLMPGSTNFNFQVSFVSGTVGELNGVNLQAGKYYTIYQAGYDNPGVGSVRRDPKIITHN